MSLRYKDREYMGSSAHPEAEYVHAYPPVHVAEGVQTVWRDGHHRHAPQRVHDASELPLCQKVVCLFASR